MRSTLFLQGALGGALVRGLVRRDAVGPILERDVVVIGGGPTGTWAAVRLRDMNKTVTLVERSARLGGNVETLYNPTTGEPVLEYGVKGYLDNKQTRDFFDRFGIKLTEAEPATQFAVNVTDFKTGRVLGNMTALTADDLADDLASYLFAAMNYTGLAEGAYNLPDPVPEDLLIPFGDFIRERNLTNLLPLIWENAHGLGDVLATPTLYVLQSYGQSHIFGATRGRLRAAGGNIQVYNAARDFLGGDVLLNSRVTAAVRNSGDTLVTLDTPDGRQLIHARQLLITIPPTLDNLAGFDLTDKHRALFGQWQEVAYYSGVVSTDGKLLPPQTSFWNADPTQEATLPRAQFVWRLEASEAGYLSTRVLGEPDSDRAKAMVSEAVARIGATSFGHLDGRADLVAWKHHDHMGLHVSIDAIRAGFYTDLYAQQGVGDWFWTGHAWCSDDSALLWQFTETTVLTKMLGEPDRR